LLAELEIIYIRVQFLCTAVNADIVKNALQLDDVTSSQQRQKRQLRMGATAGFYDQYVRCFLGIGPDCPSASGPITALLYVSYSIA